MEKKETRNTSAAVWYCLLGDRNNGLLTQSLISCQDIFEKAGYRNLYQGFAVGKSVPFAVPFQTYPTGFRCELDDAEECAVTLENLVLSYRMIDKFAREHEQDGLDYYLILLPAGDGVDLNRALNLITKLRETFPEQISQKLKVCCVADCNNQFIDASGLSGIKLLLAAEPQEGAL